MMDGYRNGIITEERLLDALTRILGLKAMLGLQGQPSLTCPAQIRSHGQDRPAGKQGCVQPGC
jgi:hypothetical protein